MSDHDTGIPDDDSDGLSLPQPRPFHITEPFQERGLWCFWLTAEQDVLEYVRYLPCLLSPAHSPFHRRVRGREMFSINPRYDYEDAWLWLIEVLESESHPVELNDDWESAIKQAYEPEDNA